MESKMRKNSCKNAILICLSSGCAFRLFFLIKIAEIAIVLELNGYSDCLKIG